MTSLPADPSLRFHARATHLLYQEEGCYCPDVASYLGERQDELIDLAVCILRQIPRDCYEETLLRAARVREEGSGEFHSLCRVEAPRKKPKPIVRKTDAQQSAGPALISEGVLKLDDGSYDVWCLIKGRTQYCGNHGDLQDARMAWATANLKHNRGRALIAKECPLYNLTQRFVAKPHAVRQRT